jgi:ribonuclease D
MQANYQFIDTLTGLENFAKSLEKETAVAIDLEADSMYHFKEKVCLLQMAAGAASVVIDPIKIKDMSSLKPLFFNRKIKKFFHGADYDVRSLYRDFNIKINNLFDTQVACMFLGYKETGLDAVLKKKFGISLSKKYQKKDWSVRPLPEKMMEYAVADVAYLIPLVEILEEELEKKRRLYWVYEESEILSKVRPAASDDNPLYLKFKGAGRLNRRNLAVLEALLQFRMHIAEKKDKPLYKVFSNKALMKVAFKKPVDLQSLKKTEAFSPKQINMYGDSVVDLVDNALQIPQNELPLYPKKRTPRVDASVAARVIALKSWRDSKSRVLAIDPGLLCNNVLISAVAVQNPLNAKALEKIEGMKNWQRQEFGPEIIALLRNLE